MVLVVEFLKVFVQFMIHVPALLNMEIPPQFVRLLLLVDHAVPFENTSLEIPQMLHCGEKFKKCHQIF